jgi:hypothetical protein
MYTALTTSFTLFMRALSHPAVRAIANHVAREAARALIHGTTTIARRELRHRGYRL